MATQIGDHSRSSEVTGGPSNGSRTAPSAPSAKSAPGARAPGRAGRRARWPSRSTRTYSSALTPRARTTEGPVRLAGWILGLRRRPCPTCRRITWIPRWTRSASTRADAVERASFVDPVIRAATSSTYRSSAQSPLTLFCVRRRPEAADAARTRSGRPAAAARRGTMVSCWSARRLSSRVRWSDAAPAADGAAPFHAPAEALRASLRHHTDWLPACKGDHPGRRRRTCAPLVRAPRRASTAHGRGGESEHRRHGGGR